MNTLFEILQTAGVFVVGIALRFLMLLVVLAIMSIPVAALVAVFVGFEKMREGRTGLISEDGLKLARARRYAPSHTWLSRRFGTLRIGLDDLARHLLPGTTKVTLPSVGAHLIAGLPAVGIACGERTTTIPSPVTGRVTAVNPAVENDPDLLQSSPYGKGWLFTVKPESDAWVRFPKGAAARAWFHDERARLSRHLEAELGLAAADGGELVYPAPALLTDEKWQALVSAFLH